MNKFISDYNYIGKEVVKIMNSDKPCFIGRYGGGDYVFAINYLKCSKTIPESIRWNINNVKKYNGYYDINEKDENLAKYLDTLCVAYNDCDIIFGNEGQMVNDTVNRPDILLKPHIKDIYLYQYIESVRPFLTDLHSYAKGKKILIISPFSESIQIQIKNINSLLKNYSYPDCTFTTYTTPITYYNPEGVNYPHKNWNETLEHMKNDIINIDFDIAFLSCASYAMGLGHFIKNTMKKKAIYIGGILNVFFNIYGARYDTPFFNGIVNLDKQIKSVETPKNINDLKKHNQISEGYNAYF